MPLRLGDLAGKKAESLGQSNSHQKSDLTALESLMESMIGSSTELKRGPKRAVIDLLRHRPRRSTEVVDILENTIRTKVSDRRRLLFSTISNLRRSETVFVNHDGLLALADPSEGRF
jgi:hypothetical protein